MLISVVMAAPDYKARLKDAASLLDYGFARCCRYIDNKPAELPELSVKKGKEETVSLSYDGTFRYLDTEGHSISDVKKEISLPEKTEAPIKNLDALRSFMRKTLNVRDISTAFAKQLVIYG